MSDIPPELYTLFLSSLRKSVERIQGSLASRDLEGVSFHAHAIRGTCGAYGHDALSVQAGRIEDLADDGKLEEVQAAVTDFSASAQAVLDTPRS